MVNHTFFKDSHKKAITLLDDRLVDIEHFRTFDPSPHPERAGVMVASNTAVVVMEKGVCFVGKSYCAPHDIYNHSRGYEVALGRALSEAAFGHARHSNWLKVPGYLRGKALRNAVKEKLTELGIVHTFVADQRAGENHGTTH